MTEERIIKYIAKINLSTWNKVKVHQIQNGFKTRNQALMDLIEKATAKSEGQ